MLILSPERCVSNDLDAFHYVCRLQGQSALMKAAFGPQDHIMVDKEQTRISSDLECLFRYN